MSIIASISGVGLSLAGPFLVPSKAPFLTVVQLRIIFREKLFVRDPGG